MRECRCRFTKTQQMAYAIGYGLELLDFLDCCIALVKAGTIPKYKQPKLLEDVRGLTAQYRRFHAACIK